MIFDFFTARLQRNKYETQGAMSMGFKEFFEKIFTQRVFLRFSAVPSMENSVPRPLFPAPGLRHPPIVPFPGWRRVQARRRGLIRSGKIHPH